MRPLLLSRCARRCAETRKIAAILLADVVGYSRLAGKTQGKWLSPVLLELGWRRKRIWSGTGQYHRYWVPPAHAD
jgi:hypothetical protein